MSPVHRRYLLLEQGIGAGVVNLAINAAIAWAMFRGMTTVPLWGDLSIGGDTIGTTFFLPFLTTLFASRAVRGHVRRGRVPALPWGDPPGRRVPRGLAARGALLGVLCVLVVGLPTAHGLDAAGVAAMSFGDFLVFKALFAAVLGMLVTPVVARAALADG
jgi:hypothetical protein